MFISNNRPSFHLWWKKNLVKHRNISRYYETDCSYQHKQTNLSGKNISLFPNSQDGNFFFGWWGTSLSSGTLSNRCFFEVAEVVADDGAATKIVDAVANDGETTEIVDVVADDGEVTETVYVIADDGFLFLNISATFWECLAAHFKSFLPIFYTYHSHTTTLMVNAKWFIWSHSSNVWRLRTPLKKEERKKLR